MAGGRGSFPQAAFARAWLSLADAELGHTDDARTGLSGLAKLIPQRASRRHLAARRGAGFPPVRAPERARISRQLVLHPASHARHIVGFTAPQPVVCLGSAWFLLGPPGDRKVPVGGGHRPFPVRNR